MKNNNIFKADSVTTSPTQRKESGILFVDKFSSKPYFIIIEKLVKHIFPRFGEEISVVSSADLSGQKIFQSGVVDYFKRCLDENVGISSDIDAFNKFRILGKQTIKSAYNENSIATEISNSDFLLEKLIHFKRYEENGLPIIRTEHILKIFYERLLITLHIKSYNYRGDRIISNFFEIIWNSNNEEYKSQILLLICTYNLALLNSTINKFGLGDLIYNNKYFLEKLSEPNKLKRLTLENELALSDFFSTLEKCHLSTPYISLIVKCFSDHPNTFSYQVSVILDKILIHQKPIEINGHYLNDDWLLHKDSLIGIFQRTSNNLIYSEVGIWKTYAENNFKSLAGGLY